MPVFTVALFTTAKTWKQPKYPSTEDKGDVVHIHNGICVYVAIPFSRASSQPRDWTWVFSIAGRFFTVWATRDPNGILFICKREWNNAACRSKDGPRDCHTESVRERQIPYDITYVWNLKKAQMNLFTKQGPRCRKQNLQLPGGNGGREG